ncbi:hypothetical protein [uncultured Marinobacter sp.]|uniref:hypothetical protein n=1 Tax=uncultured Marinobacter sp. TaxID=187379 RepID=UPI0030DD7FEA|tara:strand:- start:888 stop:1352 length:465 start_codon:yes stop_codon:yes gene_type:complete
MGLTYGLRSVRELFAKLQRDAKLLDEEVTSDRLFNFVLTGYSMIDWVRNDPSISKPAKSETEIDSLYADYWLKICGDLATASKHFKLTKRQPITRSATSSQGYSVGRYGKGGYGVGEEAIQIELDDGARYDVLEFVNGVVEAWKGFFYRHQIFC